MARLDRLARRGSLVPREEAEAWVGELAAEIKTAFMGLPRRLAPVIFGKEHREIEGIIGDEIKRILRKLARPPEKKNRRTATDDL